MILRLNGRLYCYWYDYDLVCSVVTPVTKPSAFSVISQINECTFNYYSRPYKGDKLLELGGQKMDSGCQLKDYEVQIGEGMCENRELFTNLLQCAPPTTPPALGEYPKDGAHRVCVIICKFTINSRN